jgi:hypothetical protein
MQSTLESDLARSEHDRLCPEAFEFMETQERKVSIGNFLMGIETHPFDILPFITMPSERVVAMYFQGFTQEATNQDLSTGLKKDLLKIQIDPAAAPRGLAHKVTPTVQRHTSVSRISDGASSAASFAGVLCRHQISVSVARHDVDRGGRCHSGVCENPGDVASTSIPREKDGGGESGGFLSILQDKVQNIFTDDGFFTEWRGFLRPIQSSSASNGGEQVTVRLWGSIVTEDP